MVIWILISVFGGALIGFATASILSCSSRSELIRDYEHYLAEIMVENKVLRTACDKMKKEIERRQ